MVPVIDGGIFGHVVAGEPSLLKPTLYRDRKAGDVLEFDQLRCLVTVPGSRSRVYLTCHRGVDRVDLGSLEAIPSTARQLLTAAGPTVSARATL